MWAAAGNHTTCDLQGFAAILGVNGSSLYSLSLSIYFFCVVKQVPEDKLKKLIEPLLHATPILVAMSTAIYLYVGEYYNSTLQAHLLAFSARVARLFPSRSVSQRRVSITLWGTDSYCYSLINHSHCNNFYL